MFNLKLKNIGIIAGLSLSLIVAGCGSSDANASGEVSVSAEMEYTITGIEPGAGQTETNELAMAEYDSLNGWEQELSSTGAMLTELDEAIANEEPIMVTAWTPHYMFAQWDLKFLEDPLGIYGEEEEGITIVRKGLQEDMPEAYELMNRFHWEVSEIENALLGAKDNDMEVAAQQWVEENQDTVAEWTEGIDPVNGDSIELVTTVWDDGMFRTEVAKIVFEQLGFNVTLTPVDPAIMFTAIATGDGDASLAPWLPHTHGELYEANEGEFEDLGANFTGAKIGLAVPTYMEIDSLEDLQSKE